MGYDDALDAFGVHAVGGIFGGVATGFFAMPDNGGFSGVYYAGLEVGGTQLGKQIYGIVVTCGWAAFMTAIICYGIEYTIGLRVSAEAEEKGLDSSIHGETVVVESSSPGKALNGDSTPRYLEIGIEFADNKIDSDNNGTEPHAINA